MEQPSEPQVQGRLVKDLTLVSDADVRRELECKGYGETIRDKFFLKPFESLYLLYCDKLQLIRAKKTLDFNALMQICKKYDKTILTKFLIYRDLRSRGYAVKDGFGFGSDFRVYERGHFGTKGAKYVIFGLNEGTQERIGDLQEKVEQITQMGKEPIVAVIERRGEIIYYRLSKIGFLQNKAGVQDRIEL